MRLFLFSYNMILIVLYAMVGMVLYTSYTQKRKKILLYGTGVYLFYIFDAFIIFVAEFLVYDMSTMDVSAANLITYLPFKLALTFCIPFMYLLIFKEMLQIDLKIYQMCIWAGALVVAALLTKLIPDQVSSVFWFYTVRQFWSIILCLVYFFMLKGKDKTFYGRKFKPMMTVYFIMLFFIMAEDYLFIHNIEWVNNLIPWINERNISEDVMTIIILVMVIRLVKKTHLDTTEISSVESKEEQSTEDKVKTFANAHGLTDRETDILKKLLDGKTNQEIGDELFISAGTVKWHIHQIYEKTGCQRRSQLIVLYNEKPE